MTVKNTIEKKLKNQLQPTLLEVIDESALHAGHRYSRPEGETHFRVRVKSDAFSNLSRLEAHRMVHEIIKEELLDPVHALSLETFKP